MVVTDDGIEPRQVEIGVTGDDYVEILTGLTTGERVAVRIPAGDDDDQGGNFRGGGFFGS
jgi:multidrug efflux pump subunit AcrA (membrane-fusion protein)